MLIRESTAPLAYRIGCCLLIVVAILGFIRTATELNGFTNLGTGLMLWPICRSCWSSEPRPCEVIATTSGGCDSRPVRWSARRAKLDLRCPPGGRALTSVCGPAPLRGDVECQAERGGSAVVRW